MHFNCSHAEGQVAQQGINHYKFRNFNPGTAKTVFLVRLIALKFDSIRFLLSFFQLEPKN